MEKDNYGLTFSSLMKKTEEESSILKETIEELISRSTAHVRPIAEIAEDKEEIFSSMLKFRRIEFDLSEMNKSARSIIERLEHIRKLEKSLRKDIKNKYEEREKEFPGLDWPIPEL